MTVEKSVTKLGYMGLGLMGRRFAQRLHEAGWKVTVWNRSVEPVQELTAKGLTGAESVAALVASVDVVMSCLANDAAVEAVMLGDGGVIAQARPGQILVEMSTISAELSARLHAAAEARGVTLLDVAVAGSTPAVVAGTVTLLGGGDKAAFDALTPVFEAIAKQWFLMGPATSGIRMKLVVNLLLGVNMAALAEAIRLGLQLGLERGTFLEALSKTAVIPPAMGGKFKKIGEADFAPEFPLRLMSKDLGLVESVAQTKDLDLPVGQAAAETFAALVDERGDMDLSAVAEGL